MRTRCVTLLLCTVCGLNLHAADRSAPGAVPIVPFRLTDPLTFVGGNNADSPWSERVSPAVDSWFRASHEDLDPPQRVTLEVLTLVGGGGNDWVGLVADDEPAEPHDIDPGFQRGPLMTVQDDLHGFLPGVWRDARGIVRSENMLILGAALAASIGIRQDLDDEIREEVAAHPNRWGKATEVLGYLGEAQYQVPVLGLVWLSSFVHRDRERNDFSHALISAYTINGLSVLVIKGIADTDRPDPDWNGGRWGFPSFHAASAFTIAGVVDEYYGWPAAVPAYTLAGLISWSRIDEQDHDLSDVVFGAAMGWVIGKSVAGTHLRNDGRVMLMPWSHPYERANGVALEVRY